MIIHLARKLGNIYAIYYELLFKWGKTIFNDIRIFKSIWKILFLLKNLYNYNFYNHYGTCRHVLNFILTAIIVIIFSWTIRGCVLNKF
jgi:hypothetical protein